MLSKNGALLKRDDEWLLFTDPISILEVYDEKDVIPALKSVEASVEERSLHAVGFVSYEAAPAFDPALRTHPSRGFPLLRFGLYGPPRVVELPSPTRQKMPRRWVLDIDRTTYGSAIDRIKELLAEGKTYQVNFTTRLRGGKYAEDPWEVFLGLARDQNEHAAYIDAGNFAICSVSPELFFRLDGEEISCKPMKGTVRRGCTTAEDAERAAGLRNSEKNRAENLMIVDMVRNDLGRIAEIGSVTVPELFALERHFALWQMTSTVKARTKASLAEIFTALFPCASVTGAPKVSTMSIIRDLEARPRRIYTGSIGYFGPNRKAEFNVAIRTLLVDRKMRRAEYGTGGGIVADSTAESEFEELLLKARILTDEIPLFSLVETILWTPDEGFFLLERHLARLADSASYFDFPLDERSILDALNGLAQGLSSPQRIRLLVDRKGRISTEKSDYTKDQKTLKARLADRPIRIDDPFLFHKTTNRSQYETARRGYAGCDDMLLWNDRGELTEFTIGNLVAEMHGELFTPPISSGLLSGVFRAQLLEKGRIREKKLYKKDMADITNYYLVNSVRKMVKVILEKP